MNTDDQILSEGIDLPRCRKIATLEFYCYPFSEMAKELCSGLDEEIRPPSDYSDYSEYSAYLRLAAQRRLYVRDHVQRRTSGAYSPGGVRERALERYFLLINAELSQLRNFFTEAEFGLLLEFIDQQDIHYTQIPNIDCDFSDMVFPTIEQEAIAATVSAKLSSLSLAQRFALVDVLEQCNRRGCSCKTAHAERSGLVIAGNITKDSV